MLRNLSHWALLGAAVACGLLEFVALQRSRYQTWRFSRPPR